MVEHLNPSPPKLRETLGHHYTVKDVPADRVKGFAKIELENPSWSGALVAGLHQVNGIDKIFGNGPPEDEPSLVWVDEERNEILEPKGQAFRMDFETTILERDRTKIVRSIFAILPREEDNVKLVDAAKVRREAMETIQGI
jgi:hypothetical protein